MEKTDTYRLKIGQFTWPEELELVDAMQLLQRLRSCVHHVHLERVNK
jgi:hypothetical protein